MSSILAYAMSLDTGGFNGPLGQAQGKLAAFGNLGNVMTGIRSSVDLVSGAIQAMLTPMQKAIQGAADFEGARNQFTILLGSVDAAQKRIEELAKFAADTPFEMPEILETSRKLEILTKGALSTGPALTLIGDAAAGVNTDVSELATWVGRLYDGLQNNRPVGEAMARLQELGVISGDVRDKIEKAAPGQGWAMAEAALGRFSGSMKLQSSSWNGLMSTLQDAIGAVYRAMGAPIIDALRPMLREAISMMESMAGPASQLGASIGAAAGNLFEAFKGGRLGTEVKLGLSIAFKESANVFYASLVGATAGLATLLSGVMEGFMKSVSNGSIWEGIGHMLKSAFAEAVAFLKAGVADIADAMSPTGKSEKGEALRISAGGDKFLAGIERLNAKNSFTDGDAAGIVDGFMNSIGKALDAGQRGFNDAKKPFDSSDEQRMLGMNRREDDALRKEREAREKQTQADALPKKAVADAAIVKPVIAPVQSQGDALSKIGLFIGGSGPASEHARRTADNTGHLIRKTGELITAVKEGNKGSDAATWL